MSTAPSRELMRDVPADVELSGEYTRLRELIIGPEQVRLEELRRRLDDRELRTEDVSQVLAEAIAVRSHQDRTLQQTLNPLVEEALRISVTRNPTVLANALFPMIGEAVRKSVAHALRGLVESINQTLERSVSLEALQWRIEALRTGKSFGEVVLVRSVHYRVEQVFLIHRETGLLLLHVSRPEQLVTDTDLVSGMLTAIQDFAHDSFSGTGNRHIDTIELGDCNLWVQHGPTAMLAAVVSGAPPPQLRGIFESTLERIHQEYASLLASFHGDSSEFVSAQPMLTSCLLGRQDRKPATRSKSYFFFAMAIFLLAVGSTIFFMVRSQRRWDRMLDRLRQEPGILLIADRHSSWGGAQELLGLRDPLSTDPNKLIQASGFDPAHVHSRWQSFVSSDPKISASRRFLEEKKDLEELVLRFPLNSVQLPAEQLAKLDQVETLISRLQRDGADAQQIFVIELHGHTDPTGDEGRNGKLSERRADEVRRALVDRGINEGVMRVVAVGSREPEHREPEAYTSELNRRVSFHVLMLPDVKR